MRLRHAYAVLAGVVIVGACSSAPSEDADTTSTEPPATTARATATSASPSSVHDTSSVDVAAVEAVGAALNISMLGRATIASAEIDCAVAALAALPEKSSQAIDALVEDPLNWSRIDDDTLLPIAEAYIGCVDEGELHGFIVLNALKLTDAQCVVAAWDGMLTKEAIAASATYASGLEDLEPTLVKELAARAVPCGRDQQWWIDDVAIELTRLPMPGDQAQCVATAYINVLGVEEVLRRRLLGIPLLDVPVEARQRLALADQCGVDPPFLVPTLDVVVGDCLAGFGQGREMTAIVDCEQPHSGEVLAVHDLGADHPQWPGIRVLRDEAVSSCQQDLDALTGDLAGYGFGWDIPSRISWERGDRRLTCALVQVPDGASWRGPSGLIPEATVPSTTVAATTTSILPTYLGAEVDPFALDPPAVGSCLYQEPPRPGLAEEDRRVWITDCDQPHHGELYHVVTLEGVSGIPFPGEGAVSAQGDNGCVAAFAPYVGVSVEASRLNYIYLYPLEAQWVMGDRFVQCILYGSSVGELLTRSMAGSGE